MQVRILQGSGTAESKSKGETMTKKHFIALADAIREHNRVAYKEQPIDHFSDELLNTLADFCQSTNPNFNRERWLAYIAGECGPNGGKSGKK